MEVLLVRVCVAEAESMATALSRSPLYARGGHLHAFEKLFVAHSIHRQEDMARALFFGTALGRFKKGIWRCWYGNCLGGKASCQAVGMGRPRHEERFNCEGVGEESCLGGKASWGWAAEKGAAKVRCD